MTYSLKTSFKSRGIYSLNLGTYLQEEAQIQKPVVGFNVGVAHSGIEDMLRLPEPLLRKIITHANEEYIAFGIEEYGQEDFCTTRIIKPDSNGDYTTEVNVVDEDLLRELRHN